MSIAKRALRALGKGDRKIAVVFATRRESADVSVRHLRAGLDLPIWLFCREQPSAETAAICEQVIVEANAFRLWRQAQQRLWPFTTALAVADWTGGSGHWPLKAAPFSIPPFRVLLLNESNDFFSGSPVKVLHHVQRRMAERRKSAQNRVVDLARGAGLFCFAFVAQWNSPLSRFAFQKLRREESLELDIPEASNGGVVRFSYRNREWDSAALAKLVAETDAQWILFERVGAHESFENLLLPLSDPQTFVVSPQPGRREWRRLLFATAPFRALQRDEFSRVLAPISSQMLVNRAKLAALGLSDLSSFGANWLLLFWKAAAAGWHSYSVGAEHGMHRLPAVPYDEAEFVKTLLDRSEYRRLKPRAPELSRGNIAQSAFPGPRFRDGFPRVLVVSPYLPYPLSHGGAVRIYNLCRALADRVDFLLACFREVDDHTDWPKLHEVFREVFVVDIDEKHPVAPDLPKQVSDYENSAMRALIGEVCRTKDIAVLQIEYTQMAAYREAAPGTPAILVEHDLTFTLYQQFAERDTSSAAQRDYQKWLRFERERLRAFDIVWTMCALDRDRAIQEGAPADHTFAVPNGVDLRRFTCGPKTTTGDEIFFVGSFRHRPNYLGFEELRNVIMPLVWRRFPDTRLRVVAGPDHLKHWPGAKQLDARITVYGFVEDLIPLYQEASLVVVPLPVSAGTNIKLMEALACKRAVVTTPVACAGLDLIDESDALIRDLGEPFAEAIGQLLADPANRENLAACGRRTAVRRFSWDSIAAEAWKHYQAMPVANLSE